MATKKELDWIAELQEVLNKCPSKNLGFFTVGDPYITIFDNRKLQKIYEKSTDIGLDFCNGVHDTDAEIGSIAFPNAVHSTAG